MQTGIGHFPCNFVRCIVKVKVATLMSWNCSVSRLWCGCELTVMWNTHRWSLSTPSCRTPASPTWWWSPAASWKSQTTPASSWRRTAPWSRRWTAATTRRQQQVPPTSRSQVSPRAVQVTPHWRKPSACVSLVFWTMSCVLFLRQRRIFIFCKIHVCSNWT